MNKYILKTSAIKINKKPELRLTREFDIFIDQANIETPTLSPPQD